MNRVKFIDRVAQGKISRRRLLTAAAAFGVGTLAMPLRSRADEVLTCMEWSGYDQAAVLQILCRQAWQAAEFLHLRR